MKQYSIEELKAEFAKHSYKFPAFHLIGIRSRANAKNQFDDLIAVINNNEISWYTCTTNPGTYWLLNLANPKGAAVLKPGQYVDSWQIGLHQGKYQALTQCKPIAVYRDGDRDEVAEALGQFETGMFGINIHRANDKLISKLIDKWSAGCQVLNNPQQFTELLNKCKATKNKTFTYTLLNEF